MAERLKDMFDLTGKVAIVTGGHAWLGNDMAKALAEFGCSIIITSREKERADAAAKAIADEFGVDAIGLQLEQKDYASVQKMADDAYAWKGHIDILINNAGGGSGKGECDFLKRDPAIIQSMIDVNLVGSMFCSQAVGRYMAKQKSGSIINIGSIAGIVGRDRTIYHKTNKMEQPVEYAASKGGVIAYTRDLAAYMSQYGVRVNSISPGGFDKGEVREFVSAYGELTPLGRMGQLGKELKGAALFLASDASSYVTGHNLAVDGGFSTCK
ncbi:MAG: SDR family oxidoreductase [Spirochaetales bacterium]|nr:SDR family oxidoreductase [Spirochaetales bacterium]